MYRAPPHLVEGGVRQRSTGITDRSTPIATGDDVPRRLITCPYFEVDRLQWATACRQRWAAFWPAAKPLLIDGRAAGDRFANGEFVMAGACAWILPAAMSERWPLHADVRRWRKFAVYAAVNKSPEGY